MNGTKLKQGASIKYLSSVMTKGADSREKIRCRIMARQLLEKMLLTANKIR